MNKFDEFFEEYKFEILIVLLVFTVMFFVYVLYVAITQHIQPKKMLMTAIEVNTDIPQIETHYAPTKEYFSVFGTTNIPDNYESYSSVPTEEEREKYQAYVEERAHFNEESAAFEQEYLVSNANRELYDLADKYYQVYWGNQRVSPIYPLAVANVETGNRADHSITWSALFPSKYVDINKLYTMDVTTVVSDSDIYSALSKESSTRDRGALQMSPTYGTGNSYFNSLMSGTEKAKLSQVSTDGYSTWASRASDEPGDRFYVPDVCLRLSAANTDAIQRITENGYEVKSDTQLIAMLGMYHHRSGVWSYKDHSKSIAEWKSGEIAYEYAMLCGSAEMVKELKKHAMENEDEFWISADYAKSVFKQVTGRDMTEFASKTLVCTYPIKLLYSYIKLSMMYSK